VERLRQATATIRKHLGGLSSTQKVLIGAIAVVAAMAMFLVAQYAGKPALVELLPGVPPADQQRAATILRASNFQVREQDGRLMVEPGAQGRALAMLQEENSLPDDTTVLFRNIIDKQSWQNSRTQNDQIFQIALQNELSRVIGNFRGIKSATVLIDAPQAQGLGSAVRKPTASVTIFTENGRAIEQPTVDAVASLVSGAKAGLAVESVRVIDGSTGRQRTPTAEDDTTPNQYREAVAAEEDRKRKQLLELVSHIPGVVVAVTAEVDLTRRDWQSTTYNSPEEGGTVSLPARETKTTNSEGGGGAGNGEPGLRSNQSQDISRGSGGGGPRSEKKDSQMEMDNRIGSKVERVLDARGNPTRYAASINVPEGYVEGLVRRSKEAGATGGAGAGESAVSAQEIRDRFDEISATIRASLLPHLKTSQSEGVVSVSLVPIEVPPAGVGSESKAGLFGSGGGGVLALGEGSSVIEKGVLGLLALVAVGMMVMMVKRGGKTPELPSPAELMGVPPTLETGSSVVGEADETETAMAGIEIEEDSVRVQKMLEQLSEMVTNDPSGTTRMLNRWLQTDH